VVLLDVDSRGHEQVDQGRTGQADSQGRDEDVGLSAIVIVTDQEQLVA
jgi:hypothetical protein